LKTFAIVLAGGTSSRFRANKGIATLAGKPLINNAVDAIRKNMDDPIVVTSSDERVAKYTTILSDSAKFVEGTRESNAPLIGALTGFDVVSGKYTLVAF
jgi:molybdopterin-guanine dinucleotide biosynthesis protein A